MEDILDVYTRPEDSRYPLVCMDECPKQLIGGTRIPLPPEPGQTERFDTEYVRNGIGEIFMYTAPLLGWRRAEVTEHRTRLDWAEQTRNLADEDFPDAEKIILVMDNLTPIVLPRYMRRLNRRKRGGYETGLRYIIRPNRGVGLIGRR